MNDPWHQDTLEGLVATIEATKAGGGTAYAVVVVSSERLGGEVVGELRQRIGGAESLRVCTYADPRGAFQRRLDELQQPGFRTTIIQGLPTVLESARGEGLLEWLNFRRESFTRPGEAFVFVLTREAADRWEKQAPDLDRYTAHYGFEDWDDLVEAAERRAATVELEGEDGETQLRQAKERLEQARKLGGDAVVGALLEVAKLERRAGLHVEAERRLSEAWSLAQDAHPMMRSKVVLERAWLLVDLGHPDAALQALRSPDGALIDKGSMADALAWVYTHLGKDDEASSYRENPAAGSDIAQGFIRGERPSMLDEAMKELRRARHMRFSRDLIWVMSVLAEACLEAGLPHRCLEILDEARNTRGSQYASSLWDFVFVRWKARWVLEGPVAAASVVYEEEQRQRGWTAPHPAVALIRLRGFASSSDEDARRHLEEAAVRSRAMGVSTSEIVLWLARLDRFQGDLAGATARIEEVLASHVRHGYRPLEARYRTELSMIALGRREPQAAHDHALQALSLIRACGTRLYEPAALLALAAAERMLGKADIAEVSDRRWRRLVRGIDAKGLEAALERDASWTAALALD